MKDAYSFDADEAGLDASYDAMFEAYKRIFARCGVPTLPVEADSGAIGGKESREFVYLSDTGEDTIVICDRCGYAANTEKAEFVRPPVAPEEPLDVEPVETPGTTTIEALATFLGVPTTKTAKAVFYMATDPHDVEAPAEPVFVVVRGDLQVNEVKLRNLLGGKDLRPMTDAESASYGIVPGYASPVGIDARVRVVADDSIAASPNLVAGANALGRHLRNVNLSREYHAHDVIDVALAEAGHTCGRCGEGILGTARGIEMGHVFRLGYIYSEAFDVRLSTETGEQQMPIMGCYGLGVDRVIAGAVQERHDERGIVWPASIAPFDVHLVGLGLGRDADLAADAEALYEELTAAGLEVLYDDRDESPGVKFNDADLIGVPLRVTASSRNHKAGVVEVLRRAGGDPDLVPRAEVAAHLVAARAELLSALR